jgi:hypothetical protein
MSPEEFGWEDETKEDDFWDELDDDEIEELEEEELSRESEKTIRLERATGE